MAYDVQLRPELIKSGYTDQDIGYDEGRKMTTLKGQDFLGAGKYTNVAGSTFTDRMNFDNALKKYNQGQQPLQVRQQPTPQMSSITSAGGQPTNPVNQADQRYNELLNMLYQQAQNPQPVDVNAIYASPQYAAQQAQAQRGAQQGIRASQEALGSAGFGRSTTLGESAQREQNRANEYLQTQVLPQLMAQEQAQRQRQSQDQFSVLDALTKERNTADQLALQEAQLTGRLVSDQDRTAQPLLDQLATLGQAWQTASSPEEKLSYSQQADRIRGQLEQMGVNPSLYDPNLSTEQRRTTGQELGTPTLGAQGQAFNQDMATKGFEYQQTRDQRQDYESDRLFDYASYRDNVGDEKWKTEFQQSVKQQAQQMGYNYASLNQRERQMVAEQTARADDKAYSRMQDQFTQGMEAFKTTGKMPDYMTNFGINTTGFNDDSTKEAVSIAYGALSGGQMTPEAMLKQVEFELKQGIIDKKTADSIKETVYFVDPSFSPASVAEQKAKQEKRQKLIKDTYDFATNIPSIGITKKVFEWSKGLFN